MTQNPSSHSLKRLALVLVAFGLCLGLAPESQAIPFPNQCSFNQDSIYQYYSGNYYQTEGYSDEYQVGYKRVYGCNSQFSPSSWGSVTPYYTVTCAPCSLN